MSTQALLRFSPTHLPAPRSVAMDFLAPERRFPRALQITLDRQAGEEAALEKATRRLERALGQLPGTAALEIGGIDLRSEPYPEEERFRPVMRPLLERLADSEGLQLLLRSRSPLLLRDLDLLRQLDHHHGVTVRVPLSSLEPSLARVLEGPVALPQARLRMVEQLAGAGLAAEILYAPILPGINDGERLLESLFHDARRRGARDLIPRLFTLRPTCRRAFLRWLEEELPEQVAWYGARLDRRGRWPAAEAEHRLAAFRRLRLEHGFPRSMPGRG